MEDTLLFNSLEVLQFRVASLRLQPAAHPLAGDDWGRALRDCFRVPLRFPATTLKVRLIVFCWALMTMLAPRSAARRLVGLRYR
jgi:hypothetical protein